MTEAEIGQVLVPLFEAFPTLYEFYKRRPTMRESWVKQLQFVSKSDATTVVNQLIEGSMDLPSSFEYDRVALLIRRSAVDMASRRSELKRVEKYLGDKPKHDDPEIQRFFTAMRELARLGKLCRDRAISEETNLYFCQQVKDWYGGKRREKPQSLGKGYEWLAAHCGETAPEEPDTFIGSFS